jgi:excisionase family DNA binding protein
VTFEETLRAVVFQVLDERLRPIEDRLERLAARQSSAPPEPARGVLLSLSQASGECGFVVDTVRRAIRRGDLAGVKGRKEWRVKRGDLLAWLEKRTAHALSSVDVSAKASRLLARAR